MANPGSSNVLTLNRGSSSIKFALFAWAETPRRMLTGSIDRIGLPNATFQVRRAEDEKSLETQALPSPDCQQAVDYLINWLEQHVGFAAVAAIGHRIVHGGPRFTSPQRLDATVLAELKRLSPLDPAHLPGEIALIEAFSRHWPDLPQIACFDTAFHASMPRVAQLLPIPRRYESLGIRRYGFHGISYTYLLDELARISVREATQGRIILAHLGAGASLAAVRAGQCLDTTMGFTPTSGLVMGTRSGDLDPGLLIHLLRTEGMTPDQLDDLVNRRSGLLGVSEITSDMRDLLAREKSDTRAAEAIELFCYQTRKWLGALAAALGGLDTLVFSGGIGEKGAEVRARICEGLGFLGIRLDAARNAAHAPIISAEASPATVRVIRTDEEWMIARLVAGSLGLGDTTRIKMDNSSCLAN